MAAKKENEAKVTLWTATMKSEFSGAIMACSIEMFGYIVGGAAAREKALKIMQTRHQELTERENEKQKSPAGS